MYVMFVKLGHDKRALGHRSFVLLLVIIGMNPGCGYETVQRVCQFQKERYLMAFTLPELPYAKDALEPHIDARTMEIHHGKHHAAYTNNLNAAIEKHPNLADKSAEELVADLAALPAESRGAVQNGGGGFVSADRFGEVMGANAGGSPTGELAAAIDAKFGGVDAFKERFAAAAATRFGSGWAWLVVNKAGELEVYSTANQ